jgi:hypothetical protein
MEDLDMKAPYLLWQSALGGLSLLHISSGRSLGLRNGNGF